MLTREQILARKPARMTVAIPEWDDSGVIAAVEIQALTVASAQSITTENGMVDAVIASVITPDGALMFSVEDRETLRKLDVRGLKRLSDAIVKFNALSPEAVEEQEKNSVPGLNGKPSSA